MSISEKNYVGEVTLEYFPVNPRVKLEIDEVGYTLFTMDQTESLIAILQGWMKKYRQAENEADSARRRSQGAKDGWEIRRAKQR